MSVSFDWVVDVINSDCFSIQNVLLERAFIMNAWEFRIDARIEWSIKNMLLLNAPSHCITNMKRTKLLTPLMLCIVAMWVIRTRIEQTNMPFLSRANETLKRINIEIDISWNSTSVNSSAQASINSVKKSSSTKLNTISERATTAVVSSESDDHIRFTPAFSQSSETESSIAIQIDSFTSTSSSWPDYRDLTDSASTTSQSSNWKQSNNSLLTIDGSRSTAQASSSSFSEETSTRKVSKKDVGLLIILDCVIEIFS